jgi:hypothetical protein
MVAKNYTVPTESSSNYNSESGADGDDYIISFEHSFRFDDVRRYMVPLFNKIGDDGRVWFSGKIDKNTGMVISSKLGRL